MKPTTSGTTTAKKPASKAAPTKKGKPATVPKKGLVNAKIVPAVRKATRPKAAEVSPKDENYERPWASRAERAEAIAAWKLRRDAGKSVASGLFEATPDGMHALELTDLLAAHIRKVERAMDAGAPIPGAVGRRVDALARVVAEDWITLVAESLTETEDLGEKPYSQRSWLDMAAWIRARQKPARA